MEFLINQQPAVFALPYNFSKILIEKIRVSSLEPDKIPILKITVKVDSVTKEYKIDLKKSLTDEIEEPIFDVYTEFPIIKEQLMTIDKSAENFVKIELEKGDWIKIECTLKGSAKKIK